MAAANYPLDEVQHRSLIAYIDIMVGGRGCDHSTRYAESWAAFHEIDWPPMRQAFATLGGHCDCEIVANCGPEEVYE